ncbi:hypothetical protein ACSV9I_00430 [Rhizobium sp. G187]|uniref:hypothetical protein n=1 Tax=unclassified Rhizobium TaxID=2613769 RepID=UPI000AA94AE3|nr:hypothetical protein [Rhizobium sp. AAP43]
MMVLNQAQAPQSGSGLRNVAILVFTAKIAVAAFLISQVAVAPETPIVQAYGLSR